MVWNEVILEGKQKRKNHFYCHLSASFLNKEYVEKWEDKVFKDIYEMCQVHQQQPLTFKGEDIGNGIMNCHWQK